MRLRLRTISHVLPLAAMSRGFYYHRGGICWRLLRFMPPLGGLIELVRREGRSPIMNLDYVPLLRVMRDLHSIPRGQPPDFNGMKRFRQYLRTIFDYDKEDLQTAAAARHEPDG